MPTVLALGIDPYNYDVNYVTVSVRYSFGAAEGRGSGERRGDRRSGSG